MNKDQIIAKDITDQSISIIDRKNISISGILKINSFDNEEFLMETNLGQLGIKGKELEIVKLDTFEGTIMIKGLIDGLTYFDSIKEKKSKDSLMTRLFK